MVVQYRQWHLTSNKQDIIFADIDNCLQLYTYLSVQSSDVAVAIAISHKDNRHWTRIFNSVLKGEKGKRFTQIYSFIQQCDDFV